MENFPILSILLAIPFFSGLYLMLFIKQSPKADKANYAKYVGMLSSLFTLICSIFLLLSYNYEQGGYQFVENLGFSSSIGLNYNLGVDGLSVIFIFLTALLTIISLMASIKSIKDKIVEFTVCFLLMETFIIGTLCAIDILLFYFCFEIILIPMFLIIGIWGGDRRIYASYKFFLYTLFGSVFFILALIHLYGQTHSFDIRELVGLTNQIPFEAQQWLWLGMFITFAVKIPMFPVHTWLPDAHVQAPTSGSVMLAGILIKLGGYGMIRFLLPLFPEVSKLFAPYVIYLSLIAIVYGSLVAIAQEDMKKMIAYSSVAHMGYVTAGIFSLTEEGINGAIFQMISHGFVSAALFLVVGSIYDRLKTKKIKDLGGIAQKMPNLALVFMVFTLGSIGLPGTSGFVGEFLSLVGLFKMSINYAFIGALGVILGAVYMLRLYRDVMYGQMSNLNISALKDLSLSEKAYYYILLIFTILLGIFPKVTMDLYALTTTEIIRILG